MARHLVTPTPPGQGFQGGRGGSRALRQQRRPGFCRIALAVVLAASCAAASAAGPAAADRDGRLLSLLGSMESSYSALNDYTAIFRKREKIGKSEIYDESVLVKFQKPFKVYLKWIDETREALYVAGEYDNKVLVHYRGLFGMTTSSFSPENALLMHNNRHPITEIGFGFIIGIMKTDFTLAGQYNEMEIVKMGDDTFDGRPSIIIDLRFTPHDGRKYYAPHIISQIDKEFMLPVSISCYDANGEFREQYSYENVKTNSGLSDTDFSKENKEYNFQR
jgi:outer membrane lipoprotein-sorting protein